MKYILYIVILSIFLYFVKCEYYTSIAELEKLLDTERHVIETLDNYIKVEEERLIKLKWFSDQYSNIHRLASLDSEKFLSSPVNAYLLIKRLTTDWKRADRLIRSRKSKNVFKNGKNHTSYPEIEDLSGAASALLRLQYLYLLDTGIVASGKINGTTSSTDLSAHDCYVLGLQAYTNGDYRYSLLWLEEAWKRVQKETFATANGIEILEYLAFINGKTTNFTGAIEYTTKILYLDPNNLQAIQNLQAYRAKYAEEGDGKPVIRDLNDEEQKSVMQTIAFEKLCRGETLRSPKEERKLYCYYTTSDFITQLFVKPLKVEVLNLHPKIVLFYDVMQDDEANALTAFALPMLNRATVNDGKTGENSPANFRISKSTWLHDYMHPLVPRINKRLSDITGLDTFFAEALHVINYGIGGYYEQHYDFIQTGDKVSYYKRSGNRIATWIFYLSDVAAGGSTVFPRLNLEVKPVKGAAVFWHNLKKNREGDKRTLHAACPVLAGSKWIANKWLHEKGNELYFSS